MCPNKAESQTVEFKESWRDENLKSLCAFANTEGGRLIVGIDNDGNVVGIKNSKKLLEDLPNKINDILGIVPDIKLSRKQNKEIITIKTDYSYAPVSYHGKFYIRSGSTNQELKGKELTKFMLSKSGKDWEEYIESNSSGDDINAETVEMFKRIAAKRLSLIKQEKDNHVLLEKLNLIEDGKLKRAGILLFGKNPKKYFTGAYIKVGKFLSDTDVISSDDILGNLFEQVEKTLELLKSKYLVSVIGYKGLYRNETLEYPEEALREAVTNAVVHRDYVGAHTQIKVYPDKLVLWNEGGLPSGMKIDDLKKSHASKPRNELIADVFFKAGLIETWGRGTVKIIEECKKTGLPEPEFKEEFGGFSVYFYKKTDFYSEDNLKKLGLNQRQIKLAFYIKENKSANLSSLEGIMPDVSRKTLYRDLRELVDKNVLKATGAKKLRMYKPINLK